MGTKQTKDGPRTEPNHGEGIAEIEKLRPVRKFLILKPSSILARHRSI